MPLALKNILLENSVILKITYKIKELYELKSECHIEKKFIFLKVKYLQSASKFLFITFILNQCTSDDFHFMTNVVRCGVINNR